MASPLDTLLARPPRERRLGPYQLEEQLGRGGFAPVWKAREVYGDTEVRTVAIKIFSLDRMARPLTGPTSSSSGRSSSNDRVILEVRSLCQVEHPNIVRFYTLHVDEAAGVLGLVMEYLSGRSLERRLSEEGTLGVDEAAALGLQLASALRAVHEAGLVHRDVKPANVIEARGGYKLIDFGIAEAEAPARPPQAKRVVLDDLPFDLVGTRMSMLLGAKTADGDGATRLASGTVGYMDPLSVATGADATAASDLYGLGALLFEVLTGKLPATSEGKGLRGEVLDGRTRAPSLASLLPSAPGPLVALVDSLLSPEREGRPPSAAAVEAALQALAPRLPTPLSPTLPAPSSPAPGSGPAPPASSPPPPAPRPPSWPRAAAMVLGAAAAAAAAIAALTPRAPCVIGDSLTCNKRCDRGEASSCHTLGLMYERASGVPKDEVRAAEFFKKSCKLGHAAACHALGAMRELGQGGPRDEAEARQSYERSCELGDAQGCNALGIQLAAGVGGPAEKKRATQLFERACERGYANGCANLGALYEQGDGVERDEARARALYERACAEGASSSCGLLARSLVAGRGGPRDLKRAAELFDRACAGGHDFACVDLGVLLDQGATGKPDHERAGKLFHDACNEGERKGCFHLGQLHLRGEGVAADEVQAFVLFQRACERGLPAACRFAGESSATGRGVQRDEARATAFFRRACSPESPEDQPDADGCAWLAIRLREGRGADRSPDEAEALRLKACSLGASLGCSAAP